MKILFSTPLKSTHDKTPSGDQMISLDLIQYFQSQGHEIEILSHLRTHRKLNTWRGRLEICLAIPKAVLRSWRFQPDCFFTYHTYYKAPDILGALCARLTRRPYFIFEGMYSTLPAKDANFILGFKLNRFALLSSRHVFGDKTDDIKGLLRLLPKERVTYLPPSLDLDFFKTDRHQRDQTRARLQVASDVPLIVSIAMLRPDRKGPGIEFLIRSLARLKNRGIKFKYLHIGDGEESERIQNLGLQLLGADAYFLGRLKRDAVREHLNAADFFAFPGIDEGFGLVYLEAQAMKLPVVAFENGGVPDAVGNNVGGFLTSPFNDAEYDLAIAKLIEDPLLRAKMSEQARKWVETRHDLKKNYSRILEIMISECSKKHGTQL